MDRESDEGIGFSLKDLVEANIFCNTCEKEIISLKDYLQDSKNMDPAFNEPLNKQFKEHLDHCIRIKFYSSFYNIRDILIAISFLNKNIPNISNQETLH